LVLQNRSSKYWRTIRNTFGLFEKHFLKGNEPKKAPKYISERKVSGLFLRNEHQFIPFKVMDLILYFHEILIYFLNYFYFLIYFFIYSVVVEMCS